MAFKLVKTKDGRFYDCAERGLRGVVLGSRSEGSGFIFYDLNDPKRAVGGLFGFSSMSCVTRPVNAAADGVLPVWEQAPLYPFRTGVLPPKDALCIRVYNVYALSVLPSAWPAVSMQIDGYSRCETLEIAEAFMLDRAFEDYFDTGTVRGENPSREKHQKQIYNEVRFWNEAWGWVQELPAGPQRRDPMSPEDRKRQQGAEPYERRSVEFSYFLSRSELCL